MELKNHVQRSHVNIRSFLAETTITLQDLMNLQPGDIIETNRSAKSEILMQVEGRNKFAGRLGQYRGSKAIKITRPIDPSTRL